MYYKNRRHQSKKKCLVKIFTFFIFEKYCISIIYMYYVIVEWNHCLVAAHYYYYYIEIEELNIKKQWVCHCITFILAENSIPFLLDWVLCYFYFIIFCLLYVVIEYLIQCSRHVVVGVLVKAFLELLYPLYFRSCEKEEFYSLKYIQ